MPSGRVKKCGENLVGKLVISMDLHHLTSSMIRLKFLVQKKPKTEISCKNPPKPLTFWNSQGLLLGIYMVWKGYAAYDASLQHGQPIHLFTIGSNVVPKHENHDQWIHICQDKWGKWFWTHITWQRTDRHNLEILGISCACWSRTKQDDPEIPSKHVYTVITYYIILYIPIHDMETCL